MKSFSGKASLMATLVAALVGASSAQAAEIKIGVVLPLSGALSGYGQPSQKGLDIIQAITPTLKNGDTIKLIVIDDKSDKVEAANAMQRLVSSDKVDAVIGEVTSSNTLAMTKIADDSKTPLVSSTATNDRVTRNHPYVSRVCFSDSFQGVVGANLASRDLKAKTAAIVFDSSNDYSVGLAKAFRTQFLKNGGTIPIEVQAPGGSKDFKAQLASVKAKNVDMIYMPIYYTEGALIAVQSKQLGLNKPVVGVEALQRRYAEKVAELSADQDTALATIRGLDTMYVDLTRSSVDLLRLRKQSLASNSDTLNVTLTLEDGSTYSEKGRLALTEVAVDESTGSVTLRAVFPNPQQAEFYLAVAQHVGVGGAPRPVFL